MKKLGLNHDGAVKGWRDSFLLDLESLPIPCYEEKGEVYDPSNSEHTSSSEDSSEEDSSVFSSDAWFDKFLESESEELCSSSTDDDVDITSCSKHASSGPLIAQHPDVLEPSHFVKVLPGVPLQIRHKGFRLCGDNIDISIHRRTLRSDRRNQSLHYFHAYAVENQVDVSHLSDVNVHISELTSI